MVDRRFRLATLAAALLAAQGVMAAEEQKPTGLEWEFGGDVIGAVSLHSNPYFGEAEAVIGADGENWTELGIEPWLGMQFPLGGGVAFGKLSVVATGTFGEDASGLTTGLDDPSEVTLEQANVGWKVDDLFSGLENDTFTVSMGHQDYRIGSGLLIVDGTSDGGERGGWYLGMRKVFQETLLLSLKTDQMLLEAFHVANQPREGGVEGEADGINAEHSFGEAGRVGFSWIEADAPALLADSLTTLSARLDITPESGLGFGAEWVDQSSDEIEANGGFAQVSFTPAKMGWSPTFSYRFATFSGDDVNTGTDEGFRGLAYGYTDYGTWFQGEISGNYPLANGNLQSHMLRAKMTPNEAVTLNVFYFQFSFNEPESFGVTAEDWGDEFNVMVDWAATDAWYLIGTFGYLIPGDAAKQATGGSDDWTSMMFYAQYTF